jgi:hypothetical protein
MLQRLLRVAGLSSPVALLAVTNSIVDAAVSELPSAQAPASASPACCASQNKTCVRRSKGYS